ncbi:MAG: glycosyltransferase [Verrucomicrobiota bacterium]
MKPFRLLVIAPHCLAPPRDGASLRAIEITRGFADREVECLFVGKNGSLSFISEQAHEHESFAFSENKWKPALKSLIQGSHYLAEKHISAEWLDRLDSIIQEFQPDGYYLHFLWTYPKVSPLLGDKPIWIDTHNFDPEWWNNLSSHCASPLKRKIFNNNTQNIHRTLETLPTNCSLVHVSDRDSKAYRELLPDIKHLVLPNGCKVQPRETNPSYETSVKHVYFLGLLSIQMSQDALELFSEHFFPTLKDHCQVHILGSRPSAKIKKLCRKNAWRLHSDLEDEKLKEITSTMHFAILPFNYSAGSKLKLLDACGRGIPVLTTKHGTVGHKHLPESVYISNDPCEWLKTLQLKSLSKASIDSLTEYAQKFSWDQLTGEFVTSQFSKTS